MERRFELEFKARDLDRLDSWHIFAIAVDPPYQGLGISRALGSPHVRPLTCNSI